MSLKNSEFLSPRMILRHSILDQDAQHILFEYITIRLQQYQNQPQETQEENPSLWKKLFKRTPQQKSNGTYVTASTTPMEGKNTDFYFSNTEPPRYPSQETYGPFPQPMAASIAWLIQEGYMLLSNHDEKVARALNAQHTLPIGQGYSLFTSHLSHYFAEYKGDLAQAITKTMESIEVSIGQQTDYLHKELQRFSSGTESEDAARTSILQNIKSYTETLSGAHSAKELFLELLQYYVREVIH